MDAEVKSATENPSIGFFEIILVFVTGAICVALGSETVANELQPTLNVPLVRAIDDVLLVNFAIVIGVVSWFGGSMRTRVVGYWVGLVTTCVAFLVFNLSGLYPERIESLSPHSPLIVLLTLALAVVIGILLERTKARH